MPVNLFEFLEQFMIETFLMKILRKLDQKVISLISLGNLKIKFHFRNKKSITFFAIF